MHAVIVTGGGVEDNLWNQLGLLYFVIFSDI
jgi:hypothetical protein